MRSSSGPLSFRSLVSSRRTSSSSRRTFALIMGITECARMVNIGWLILVQQIVFLPLALVRDLAKLSTTTLIAYGFIVWGRCIYPRPRSRSRLRGYCGCEDV
ncbi:hypothetical protein R3P38DRAFT_3036897 [Favolaschia claudopus]|uniref:Uncharacterized protein n=1 Tax=Favolaschia claudopus TaxID=2862362 RepID=A0AAW0AAF1_9AGAR